MDTATNVNNAEGLVINFTNIGKMIPEGGKVVFTILRKGDQFVASFAQKHKGKEEEQHSSLRPVTVRGTAEGLNAYFADYTGQVAAEAINYIDDIAKRKGEMEKERAETKKKEEEKKKKAIETKNSKPGSTASSKATDSAKGKGPEEVKVEKKREEVDLFSTATSSEEKKDEIKPPLVESNTGAGVGVSKREEE